MDTLLDFVCICHYSFKKWLSAKWDTNYFESRTTLTTHSSKLVKPIIQTNALSQFYWTRITTQRTNVVVKIFKQVNYKFTGRVWYWLVFSKLKCSRNPGVLYMCGHCISISALINRAESMLIINMATLLLSDEMCMEFTFFFNMFGWL